jgi:hypothetical protein
MHFKKITIFIPYVDANIRTRYLDFSVNNSKLYMRYP